MTANRTFVVKSSLIFGALALAAVATVALLAFPGNLLVWQIGSWTLAFALLALLGLVLASAYSLVTNRAARTWQRIVYFDSIKRTRAALEELGYSPGEIKHPFYMPGGECRLEDPDGYVLMLAQMQPGI